MGIAELRERLTHALSSAEAGDVPETVRTLRAALQDVDAGRLVTTTEAARLLGVRSINTIKSWCRGGYITGITQGSRTMIPLAEIERIQHGERVQGIRTAERLHEESGALGGDDDMTQNELDALDAGRPGTPPWLWNEDGQHKTKEAQR